MLRGTTRFARLEAEGWRQQRCWDHTIRLPKAAMTTWTGSVVIRIRRQRPELYQYMASNHLSSKRKPGAHEYPAMPIQVARDGAISDGILSIFYFRIGPAHAMDLNVGPGRD